MTLKEMAKAEILTALPQEKCCIKAFLSAICRGVGSIEVSARRLNLCLKLDDYAEGAAFARLFKEIYPVDVELEMRRIKDKPATTLKIPTGFATQALIDLELLSQEGDNFTSFVEGIPNGLLENRHCKLAYFKGLFFTLGGVYAPESGEDETGKKKKTGYHFEIKLADELFAAEVAGLLEELGINTKMSERGEYKIIYVKEKREILDILSMLGLNETLLKLKSVIDDRDVANSLNRAVICETANIDKSLEACAKLAIAVQKLTAAGAYSKLPDNLIKTADVRLDNRDMSLQQVADLLGITKSCLNHRLRRIIEISETTK